MWFSDVAGRTAWFRVFAFLSAQPEPWGMEDETLGARIQRLRESRRWTQHQLAEVLTVSVKTISNWERDRNSPRNSMGALRDVFGSAIDEAGPAEDDLVLAAIAQAELDDWRRDDLRSRYRWHLQEQSERERGSA